MKLKVMFKELDSLSDSIDEALKREQKPSDISDDEQKYLHEMRREQVKKFTSRWFEYGEYLTVELDTDAQTCVVVPLPE